jgi:hypothetical protein
MTEGWGRVYYFFLKNRPFMFKSGESGKSGKSGKEIVFNGGTF